jgi:hypothetical protein
VSPSEGIVGEYGTWIVAYRVGEIGILKGGGIRVQLPEAWHAGLRNSGFRLQASDPHDAHYVSARCSNVNARLQTTVELETADVLVKTIKPSNITNRMGYYVFITRVIVFGADLRRGDIIELIYGDTSGGSPGLRAGIHPSPELPIALAVDAEGHGEFRLHSAHPTLTIKPGRPVELLLTAQSQAVVGTSALLHLAILDEYRNPAATFEGNVTISVRTGKARVDSPVRVTSGNGWVETTFTPTEAGVLRFEGFEAGNSLSAVSNPIEISAKEPRERTYWGDLHSHTSFSVADGLGSPEDAYSYGRHISGLDFCAVTDHSLNPQDGITAGLSAAEWDAYNELTEAFYKPGEFVTLHAYELSFYQPYGHHNVYFREKPGPLLTPDEVTLPELWNALTKGEALTIPHHTMKMPERVDWKGTNAPEFRRNIEIYSAHGLSETYDPLHPLAFEQSLFTNPSVSIKDNISAQKAWIAGFRLSTIASSDDHRSQPGQPQNGLAAVLSKSLTRQGIFDGLAGRKTYGTTGSRIILHFEINDAQMGQEVEIAEQARLHVRIIGTDIIDQVDVLRYRIGGQAFRVIHSLNPSQDEVEFVYNDAPGGQAIYYVRVRQRHLVGGRVAMAWSSPIWVSISGKKPM